MCHIVHSVECITGAAKEMMFCNKENVSPSVEDFLEEMAEQYFPNSQ